MLKKLLPSFLLCLLTYLSPAHAAEKTILIVGDSLSAGYGIPIEQGWVALLQKRLGSNYSVQNSSISGDTTSNGLANLPKELAQYKPILTIIALGGNDGLRGLPLETMRAQLASMIELAQKYQSKVLLLGVRIPPNYGQQYTQKFQAIYTDLGEKYKISVVPLFLKNIDDNPKLMQSDGIHPRLEAQPQMVDNMWNCLTHILKNNSPQVCA